MITGDFNSRCSNTDDFIIFDNYLDNNNQLSNDVFIPKRVSKDHVIDVHGKRLIELCQSTSFIIGNGRLHNDRDIGDYTFHSRMSSSVVDYILLYPPDIKHITKFNIEELTEFSDHCGISFSLKCYEEVIPCSTDTNSQTMYISFDENKIDKFLQNLSLKNDEISILTDQLERSDDVDNLSQQFVSILQECSLKVFGKTQSNVNKPTNNTNINKPWFNAECYNAKKQFNKSRNAFNRDKSNVTAKRISIR